MIPAAAICPVTRDAPADLEGVGEEPAPVFAVPEALNGNHVRFVNEKERRAYEEPDVVAVAGVVEPKPLGGMVEAEKEVVLVSQVTPAVTNKLPMSYMTQRIKNIAVLTGSGDVE